MAETIDDSKYHNIKDYERDDYEDGDIVRFEGKLYRAVNQPSGYTVKKYFSHTTPSMGPWPGWDRHLAVLEQYGVQSTSDLPNDPYYSIELEPINEE